MTNFGDWSQLGICKQSLFFLGGFISKLILSSGCCRRKALTSASILYPAWAWAYQFTTVVLSLKWFLLHLQWLILCSLDWAIVCGQNFWSKAFLDEICIEICGLQVNHVACYNMVGLRIHHQTSSILDQSHLIFYQAPRLILQSVCLDSSIIAVLVSLTPLTKCMI